MKCNLLAVASLAEAEPADTYTWRPTEGVRSISEVYMRIAGAARRNKVTPPGSAEGHE